MSQSAELVFRDYRPGDEARILECFQRVFDVGTPEARLRTLEHWRWQFERNPTQQFRILLAVDESAGGRVVAQYAGVPMRMFDRGERTIATQAVDSMVDPAYRRGLKRPGLFATLGAQWYAKWIRRDQDRLAYGIPVPQAWRIGNALLRYEIVRTQPILYREACWPLLTGRGVEVRAIDSPGAEFDELFQRLAPDLRYLTVRDASFLRWRFLDHPTFRYTIFGAFEGARLRGYVVARVGDWIVPSNTILVDWLVPGGDIDAARELLRAVDGLRARSASPCLSLLLPDSNPWYRDLQLEGFLLAPSDYMTVVVASGAAYSPPVLRREWYHTLADFDIA
ncbi:MAG: GNAT family N-acetyltransferase [Planctomycetes bacterium]|nr:GNAT family N-acetyltransferase [Planctomycetota bacterium]